MRIVLLSTLCATLSLSHIDAATTPPPTPAPPRPCSYKEYDLNSLASNRDLIGRIDSPYNNSGTIKHTGTYWLYANPCSDVNQITGRSQHASVFGSFTGVTNPSWDVLGYNNVSLSTWQYRDTQDPYDGVQQILTTDNTCHWNNDLSPTITTITYMCVQPTLIQPFFDVQGSIVDNTCKVDITVDTSYACLNVQPRMPCKPTVNGREWDLSLLTGLERNGEGNDAFNYYMNVCSNVTHELESNQDKNAMIIQYYKGANAYHATLANLTTPPVWSLINNDPDLGIRGTWLSTDVRNGCPVRNTTVDFLCNKEDMTTPLYFVDRDRRTFDVTDDANGCNVYITFKVRNACVLPPTTSPPTTPAPTTLPPTTTAPTTPEPTTAAPTTPEPTTEPPTTTAPTTEGPTTAAPTEPPTTLPPTTDPPTGAPTNSTPSQSTESSGPPLALSVGAGVGGGLVLIILMVVVYRCYCSNRRPTSRSINQMHARDPLLDV